MHYSQLPAELTDGLTITGVTPLSGGDISQAFRVDTPDTSYFLKAHQKPKKQMFEREARGLKALRDTAPETLGVPEVVRASSRGLMLEWIEEGGRTFTYTRFRSRISAGLMGTTRVFLARWRSI